MDMDMDLGLHLDLGLGIWIELAFGFGIWDLDLTGCRTQSVDFILFFVPFFVFPNQTCSNYICFPVIFHVFAL